MEGIEGIDYEAAQRFAALLRFVESSAMRRFSAAEQGSGGSETIAQLELRSCFGRGGAVLHGGILAQEHAGG
jgi:hypothetical protein